MSSTNARRNTGRLHRWTALAAILLCVIAFTALAYFASTEKSASFDEQYHLTAGYSYLRTGDYRLATTHPPFIGLIAGLGLLPMNDIQLPLDDPNWLSGDRYGYSDVFLWYANSQSVSMVENGRLPIILLFGGLLLLVVAVWSKQMFGILAMAMALMLVVFDPNLAANARVIGTDFGVTVMLFVAVWRTWRWLEEPSPLNAASFGLFAGLAMAAKYSGIFIWPIAAAIVLVYPRHPNGKGAGFLMKHGFGALLTSAIVLWAVYSFDFGWIEIGPGKIPAFAPFYWEQLWLTTTNLVIDLPEKLGFLLGEATLEERWYYLPVAFALKTPLALLGLVALGFVAMVRRREYRRLSPLWIPSITFLLLGVTGFVTLGYRHILPALPFLILLATNSLNFELAGGRRQSLYRVALAVLVAWTIGSSLRMYPHQEAYFNELAGRWTNWSRLLVDSNLDWGQDLPALRERMVELGIERVNLAYFGNAVPEKYGVLYHPLPGFRRFIHGYELNAYNPFTPEEGWYAISATTLRLGTLQTGTEDLYTYFHTMEPAGRAGYSIYLYQVQYPEDVKRIRTVVVDQPVAAVGASSLGVEPNTQVIAKWLRSGDSQIAVVGGEVNRDAQTYILVDANFADICNLEGYENLYDEDVAGSGIDLLLYWRRGEALAPMPAPTRGRSLSTFVQVLNEEGGVVAQYDGWDTALRGLEAGDIVIQRTALQLPEDLSPGSYQVIAGLYTPQTGDRLLVGDGEAAVDVVTLFTFELDD